MVAKVVPEGSLVARIVTPSTLGAPLVETIHEGDGPLSDVVLAESGSFCWLRREPYRAWVWVWNPSSGVAPEQWASDCAFDIISVIDFDGERLIAASRTEILRITRAGAVALWRSEAGIVEPRFNRESNRLLWRVRGDLKRICLALADVAGVSVIDLLHDCFAAHWVSADSFLVGESLGRGGVSGRIAEYDCGGGERKTLAVTSRIVSALATDVGSRWIYAAARGIVPLARVSKQETTSDGLRAAGVWRLSTDRTDDALLLCDEPAVALEATRLGDCVVTGKGRDRTGSISLLRSNGRWCYAPLTTTIRAFAIDHRGRWIYFVPSERMTVIQRLDLWSAFPEGDVTE